MSLRKYGSKLLDQGYPIVPIKAGYKYPLGLKDWQHTVADQPKLNKWLSNGFADGGVGILTNTCPAVDLDIRDSDIAQQMIDYCEKHIGPSFVRVGDAPKALLPYRTDIPFTKMSSNKYEDFLGDTHQVEILCDGQQYVAFAVHPETKKPYKWRNGESIADVPFRELPLITSEQACDLIEYFESIAPDDWEVISGGQKGVDTRLSDEDRVLMNIKPKVDVSTDGLKEHLKCITDADDYNIWIKIGMALYHQFDGGDEGYDLWCEWSQKSEKYDFYINQSKWLSFEVDPLHHEPVTAATIIYLANENKQKLGGIAFSPESNQATGKIKFTFTSGMDLFEPTPINWLIKGIIEKEALCEIFGASGTGKSFAAIDICLSITTGNDWYGHKIEDKGSVVYVAGEGKAGIKRRVTAWAQRHGGHEDIASHFMLSDRVCGFPNDTDEFIEGLHQIPDLKLLVLDTLQRTFTGDENSTKDMTAYIQALDNIKASFPDIVILVVHHTGHAAGDRARGSSVLKASMDTELKIEKKGNTVYVVNTKQKEAEEFETMAFSLETEILDWEGEDITSATLHHQPDYDTAKRATPKTVTGVRLNAALDVLKTMIIERKGVLKNGGYSGETARVTVNEWIDTCRELDKLTKKYLQPTEFNNRITEKLIEQDIITLNNGYVYLTSDAPFSSPDA